MSKSTPNTAHASSPEQLDAIQNGAGMVQKLAVAQGLELEENLPAYREMRDQMYDELLQKMV
ncbi:MAG: hypothetical protein Q4B54_06600 [Coriobacteriales bacterium]|nr:hypothetical protein [Coriobacteriales bacterium]